MIFLKAGVDLNRTWDNPSRKLNPTIFYLKQMGLAWTWFIGISVITNLIITLILDWFLDSIE